MEVKMMTQLMGGPVSQRVRFQLWVDGEVGPKEIGNLIRILEIQRGWLLEDEADRSASSQPEDVDATTPASVGEVQRSGTTEPNTSEPTDVEASRQSGEG